MEITAIEIIEEQLPEIQINFDEVKANLAENLKKYENLVITEDNLANSKKVRADLNKMKKSAEDTRKEIKTRMSVPITVMESQFKDLVAMIDTVASPIDTEIKAYDEKKKHENISKVQGWIDEAIQDSELRSEFASRLVLDDKWCNTSYTEKNVKKEIEVQAILLSSEQAKEDERVELIQGAVDSENKRLENKMDISEFNRLITGDFTTAEILDEIRKQGEIRYKLENRVAIPRVAQETVGNKPLSAPQTTENDVEVLTVNMEIKGTKNELARLAEYLKVNVHSYAIVRKR